MTNTLKIADVAQILVETYGTTLGFSVTRKKNDILLADLTGQSRRKHKRLGDALKKRGLKCNHIRNSAGTPCILIFLQWSKELQLASSLISRRLKRHWSIEETLSTPSLGKRLK